MALTLYNHCHFKFMKGISGSHKKKKNVHHYALIRPSYLHKFMVLGKGRQLQRRFERSNVAKNVVPCTLWYQRMLTCGENLCFSAHVLFGVDVHYVSYIYQRHFKCPLSDSFFFRDCSLQFILWYIYMYMWHHFIWAIASRANSSAVY